jgi:DnaK suppressor protein
MIKNSEDEQFWRALIRQHIEQLDEQLSSARESAGTVELDQSRVGRLSRMDALQTQAMHQETLRRNSRQLAELRRAEQRIDADLFGCCDECGDAIARGRLELNPAITFCINCAEKAEKSS